MNTVSPGSPALSAVVVFGEQREREERCLRHLLAQTVLDRMEIVIVDLSRDPVRMPGWDQPPVRWYHRPDLENFGAARAECGPGGVSATPSRVVAPVNGIGCNVG